MSFMAIIHKSPISINANTFKSRKNENNENYFLVVLETTITYLVDFFINKWYQEDILGTVTMSIR